MSLNMIFWAVIITVFYVAVLVSCVKEIKKRGLRSEDKGTLAGLTFFYLAVIASMWLIYPEDWF